MFQIELDCTELVGGTISVMRGDKLENLQKNLISFCY